MIRPARQEHDEEYSATMDLESVLDGGVVDELLQDVERDQAGGRSEERHPEQSPAPELVEGGREDRRMAQVREHR